jgi:hypothetical protein
VKVDALYHAGVGWWANAEEDRYLGPVDAEGNLTQLLGDRASLERGLDPSSSKRLQGEWGDFLRRVYEGVPKIQRLSSNTPLVPGCDQGEVLMHVLAPVESTPGCLPSLGGESINTNGHSILLRVNYARVRLLLTGDLNSASQRHLLEAYTGRRLEFACDVATACHHGSADVSYEFLTAMSPSATVISSGDNESHAHPRPAIVAASALTGHAQGGAGSSGHASGVFHGDLEERAHGPADRDRGIGRRPRERPAPGHGAGRLHYDEMRMGDLRPRRGADRWPAPMWWQA